MNNDVRERSVKTELLLKKKLYARMPEYIFSNDLFENMIKAALSRDCFWIDAGCGNNSLVYEFEGIAPNGLGIDEVIHPDILTSKDKFINSSLEKIPFEDNSVSLITANMVVEHIVNIDRVLREIKRVLKPGGKFIFRTTNRNYPTLFAGNLLPKKMKDFIIYKIFGVRSHDIFVTTYPINTLKDIEKKFTSHGFLINSLTACEDLHMFNPVAFEISYLMYKVQKRHAFRKFRNCIVCEVSKPAINNL
ncbi:MAG: class I SAM-dependent methyltransferase [Ignavibacteria bacterium]|nr:class I SAM-dependent methyltransferase [Ignavibacteria bacterium]